MLTLPNAPGQYQTIIVPASHVLSQEAAKRLANFTRQGGTLVLAGVSGQVDPWLKPYANVGGPAWSTLKWSAVHAKPRPMPAYDSTTEFWGSGFKSTLDGTKIADPKGRTLGSKQSWGKGTLIAYDLFPVRYNQSPHLPVSMTQWTQQLIKLAKLQHVGRFVNDQIGDGSGHLGIGVPVVEVVVRVKSETEKFIFCMNQGGAGSGEIQIPLISGSWQATDVLSNQPIEKASWEQGAWRLKVEMKPWESRVIRLFQ